MANEEKRSYRVMAMQILYSMDMNNASYQETLEFVNKELVTEDVTNLVKYVSDNMSKIDEIITRSLTNYTINRLNYVDKAIIRVSTAELLIGKLDRRIIIDEALEITKLFSDEGNHKAVAFNNRLLQSISDNIK